MSNETTSWRGRIVTVDFETNELTVEVEDAGRVRLGVDVSIATADEVAMLRRERDEFRAMCGRHDPTGADHMADAARLAVENDELREAAREVTNLLSGHTFDDPRLDRLVELLDAAEETQAILDDPGTMSALAEAEADMAAGRVTEL